MSSIKRSLNLRQALIQVLVFGIFSVGIYRFVENRLLLEFDRGLETMANAGTGVVEIEKKKKSGRIKVEIEDDHAPAYDHKTTIFMVRDPKGKVRMNPDKTDFKNWTAPEVPESGFILGPCKLPDGRPARFRSQRFMPEIEGNFDYQGGEWSLTVIREKSSIDEALKTILMGCLGLGSVATLLTLGASYLSVKKGLKPLENIGEEVTALKTNTLDHRFDTASLPSELKPITSKLNELLERMESAFERERRFTSNAAHELRTPLAELQAILQVGQKWRTEDLESDHPQHYFNDGSDVTKRMSRLLETLFTLSREPSKSLTDEKTEFCLSSALDEAASTHPSHTRVRVNPAPHIQILADEDLLIAAYTNLLNNALSHSSGEITITVSETQDTAQFTISNPAPDLTQEDMNYLCEPFWRKDRSRSNQEHLGLGLNLVESFCRTQQWELSFHLDEESKFHATISNILKPSSSQPPNTTEDQMVAPGNLGQLTPGAAS